MSQFLLLFKRFDITAKYVNFDDPMDVLTKINDKTKAMCVDGCCGVHDCSRFVETLGNPTNEIPDFKALSALARERGLILIVDNTFAAGGYLFKPLLHDDVKAHIVVHSATKWICANGCFNMVANL